MREITAVWLLGIAFCGPSFADGNPNLIYSASSGNVSLFSDGANLLGFALESDGAFLPPADFSDLDANVGFGASVTVDNIADQIGWISVAVTAGVGFGADGDATADLGDIFPTGLDEAGLLELLIGQSWEGAPFGQGVGGAFDLFVEAGGLAGDFNGDLAVDAADYTVWRNGAGDPGDFDLWVENYGASSASTAAALPEPAAALLALTGVVAAVRRR